MNEHIEYACLIDGVRADDTGRMRALIMEEVEGERSPPLEPVMEEVEKLTAADLVMKMRRVQMWAPGTSEITCAQYANSFEALSLQFAAASAFLRRHRADKDFVPGFLRSVGGV